MRVVHARLPEAGRTTGRVAPVVLGLVLVLPLAVACGSPFAYGHLPETEPAYGPAVVLAGQSRLGPDGFGRVRLGMPLEQAMATGQLTRRAGGGVPCRMASETGTGPGPSGNVTVSVQYGVAKIQAYPGVTTPEGIGLGAGLDELWHAYPDTVVETYRDMGVGIDMDDHYRTAVPGNPKATYRFFVNAKGRVDAMLLVLATQDCDPGSLD